MPEDRQGTFIAWGDSLIFAMKNRMFILADETVTGINLPFAGDRWCHGVHKYGDALYGGAEDGLLYRWEPGSTWTFVGELGRDPDTEEISALATYRGRLYVGTARDEGLTGGRLYVSACESSGSLISQVHDFTHPIMNAALAWEDFAPGEATVRFQIRSALMVEELESRNFVGPDGTMGSFFEESGAALDPWHRGDRFFQYRAYMISAGGFEMPYLRSVTLAADSLDFAGADDPPRICAQLQLVPAHPSPATREVFFELLAGNRGPISMRISDAEGRLVRRARMEAPATWRWDLRNEAGTRVPAGLYWVHAAHENTAVRQAFLVLR